MVRTNTAAAADACVVRIKETASFARMCLDATGLSALTAARRATDRDEDARNVVCVARVLAVTNCLNSFAERPK